MRMGAVISRSEVEVVVDTAVVPGATGAVEVASGLPAPSVVSSFSLAVVFGPTTPTDSILFFS